MTSLLTDFLKKTRIPFKNRYLQIVCVVPFLKNFTKMSPVHL